MGTHLSISEIPQQYQKLACTIIRIAEDAPLESCGSGILTKEIAKEFLTPLGSASQKKSLKINCHDAQIFCENLTGIYQACEFSNKKFLDFARFLNSRGWKLPEVSPQCKDQELLAHDTVKEQDSVPEVPPLPSLICQAFEISEEGECAPERLAAGRMIAAILNENLRQDEKVPVPVCPFMLDQGARILIAQPAAGDDDSYESYLSINDNGEATYQQGRGGIRSYFFSDAYPLEQLYRAFKAACK